MSKIHKIPVQIDRRFGYVLHFFSLTMLVIIFLLDCAVTIIPNALNLISNHLIMLFATSLWRVNAFKIMFFNCIPQILVWFNLTRYFCNIDHLSSSSCKPLLTYCDLWIYIKWQIRPYLRKYGTLSRSGVWIGMKVLGADSFILGTRKLWRIFPIKQKCHTTAAFWDNQNYSI